MKYITYDSSDCDCSQWNVSRKAAAHLVSRQVERCVAMRGKKYEQRTTPTISPIYIYYAERKSFSDKERNKLSVRLFLVTGTYSTSVIFRTEILVCSVREPSFLLLVLFLSFFLRRLMNNKCLEDTKRCALFISSFVLPFVQMLYKSGSLNRDKFDQLFFVLTSVTRYTLTFKV